MTHSDRTWRAFALASALGLAGAAPATPPEEPPPVIGLRTVDCTRAASMREFKTIVEKPLDADNAHGVKLRIIAMKITSPESRAPNPCDALDDRKAYTVSFRAAVENNAVDKKLVVFVADLRCELMGFNPSFPSVPTAKLADVKVRFSFYDVRSGETGISLPYVGSPDDPYVGASDPTTIGLSVFFPHAAIDPKKCRVLINA